MATTSRKRQKELKRQEKSKLQEAKRAQRKLEKAAHKEAGQRGQWIDTTPLGEFAVKNRRVQVNWSHDEDKNDPSHAPEERRRWLRLPSKPSAIA